MATFKIKRNDTAPPIASTLTAGTPAVAVDIEGASIRFHMRDSSGAMKVDAAASNDQVGDGSDGTKGMVSYDWSSAAGDTDTAGRYQAEWEVTFSDGTVRTFPTPGFIGVLIQGDLA